MPQKTSRLKSLLKSITLATGLVASPIQGLQAKNAPRDDNKDPAKEWMMKQDAEIMQKNDEYLKRYEEQLAQGDTLALTPEDFGTVLHEVDEREETEDYTRAQAYDEIKTKFGHDIKDTTAQFITQSIAMGEISMDDVAPEHYALLTSAEAIKNLNEEQRQDLSDRFIDYFNQSQGNIPDEDVLLVMKSPIAKRTLDGEKGIKLEIDAAERLIPSLNEQDFDNIGKSANGFRAYALDNTFERLDGRILSLKDGKERAGLEKQAIEYAYEYSQNGEVMQTMKNSSMMGGYALEKVFDGHMYGNNHVYESDIAVVRNIFADVLEKQNDRVALGNYNRIALEYGETMPAAYNVQDQLTYLELNNKIRERDELRSNYNSSANAVLREFLRGEITEVNKKITPGTVLDKEGDLLHRSRAFYNKSEAYQQYSDFSVVYQFVSGRNNGLNLTDSNVKIDREKLSKIRFCDNQNNVQGFDSRQIDFGMYIYYREMMANDKKAKLTNAQLEEYNAIVDFYRPEHLDRMYNITVAVHDKDFSKADKASKAIEKAENIHINVECRAGGKGLKKTVSPGQYRHDIENKANTYDYFNEEWNSVARQSGQTYQEENQNEGGANSLEDIWRQRQKEAKDNKPSSKVKKQQTTDMASSYIAEIRAKSIGAGRTKAAQSDNSAAISLAIRNNSQKTV